MTTDGHDHGRRRYLTAKRGVDERARNERVRRRLIAELPATARVTEWGPGVGLSVPTLYDWTRVSSYLGLDAEPRPCDLLYAQSFFDLVAVERALDAVRRTVEPGGVAYAPLTFDGRTTLLPRHPADETVLGAFHDSIDATGGQSRAATALVESIGDRDATLLGVGSSDWVVRPRPDGYPGDERYFLSSILDIVAEAVGERATTGGWLAARRTQLADGRLTYMAHNYDVLWRPAP